MLGRIKELFGAQEQRAAPVTGSLADPWTSTLLGGFGPTAAGVSVSPENALQCTPVYAAVKIWAETLQQLPLHLYQRRDDGGRDRATDHPVYALLSDAANGWTPVSEFRLAMETARALHGNAYAFVNRDANGVPEELVQLDTKSVSVSQSGAHEPVYKINGEGEFTRRDILHVRGFGAGLMGVSPIVEGREAIGLAIVMEQYGVGLFGRGARPSGALKMPQRLTADQFMRLRDSWNSIYQGGGNAGKTVVLEEGVEFQPVQLTSVDAQFLEMRKFALGEIARLFRVPLHMLADLDRTTHSNAEQLGQQFLTMGLLPVLRSWQDAIAISLLTPEERKTFYPEFLVDDLARADLAARFTAYSQAIASGILCPNEARQMENRAPYAGGEVFMRPVNTAPAPTRKGAANAA